MRVLFLTSLLLCTLATHAADAPPPFIYTGPSGASFTVTADGLAKITLTGKSVATGGWRAMNADWLVKGPGKVDFSKLVEKSCEPLGADRVRVRHVHPQAVVLYDYTFADEDVTIMAKVENTHPTEGMLVVGFSGLQLQWQTPPQGLMPCQHGSWLAAHPGGYFHPSMENKIGGTYGADATVGFGCSPANRTLLPTMTLWDYADWNPHGREKLPRRNLQYFVSREIPAGAAYTVGITLRTSAQTGWQHLLAPYKHYFTTLLGPVRYRADHRPLLQVCANKSIAYITPQNPYGFHDGYARLDLKEGVQAFGDGLIPLLKSVNGQGVIIWGQGGTEPRGAEYRPDFDILPPEVEANWKTLQARFAEAGLRLGVCTRPDSIPTRVSWKSDTLVDLNPNDPGHLDLLYRRFKTMVDRGCTLFYMDCFGMRIEDVKIARFLREKLGPEVQLYSEMSCDAILPYVGLYLEVHYNAAAKEPANAGSLMWLGPQSWEIMRWLVPGICTAARPHIKDADSKSGAYYRWMLERGITPLEQPGQLEAGKAKLLELLPTFLDEKGQWR
jgi:hypothetical protein